MEAYQVPPSLGFSRQEHWSGLPFPSPMHESEKWKWSCSVIFYFTQNSVSKIRFSTGAQRLGFWHQNQLTNNKPVFHWYKSLFQCVICGCSSHLPVKDLFCCCLAISAITNLLNKRDLLLNNSFLHNILSQSGIASTSLGGSRLTVMNVAPVQEKSCIIKCENVFM